MMRYLAIVLFFLCLGLDIASKHWALHEVPWIHWYEPYPFHGIAIFQGIGITFSLNLVANTGAAWGIFANYPGVLFIIRVGIICGTLIFLIFFNKGKIPHYSMWLILTGAIGNALDYWFYGYVIDFFHFTFWGYSFPVFNLADSYITLGACSLFLCTKRGFWFSLKPS